MKLSILLLLSAIFQTHAGGFSQRVSLYLQHVPLERALMEIQDQTGYSFFCNVRSLAMAGDITVMVHDVSLEEALDACLKNTPLTYTISKKVIVINQRGEAGPRPQAMQTDTLPPLQQNIDVHGTVVDEQGKPIPGVTVMVKGAASGTMTDDQGAFSLKNIPDNATLVFTSVNMATQEYKVNKKKELRIALLPKTDRLEDVAVYSTGYQKLPKERATGSFTQVNNELLNRRVSADILSRLDGVTPGLLFNRYSDRNGSSEGGEPSVSIRGRSTLFADTEPLIILDNFPYEAGIANINPNDIESVTILKDAAAASIWGVRAGNGVIVLTSKRGKMNQAPKISLNSNVTISGKPDLFALPQMTSSQYIDMEKFYFDHGKYDVALNYQPYGLQSPVIDLLEKIRKNPQDQAALTAKIDALRKLDVRNDLLNYFYRNAVNQQHAVNIQGGSANDQYYFSAGYDKNIASFRPLENNRITLNARNTYRLLDQRLELNTDITYFRSRSFSGYSGEYGPMYPYEQTADALGNPLPVVRDFRQASKDAFANAGLLDWNYYPLKERDIKNNQNDESNYALNLGINYKIIPGMLTLSANYQFQQDNASLISDADTNTYAVRNLINWYSSTDSSGAITFPIPVGSILNTTNSSFKYTAWRFQLNFNKTFHDVHAVSFLGGVERKDYSSSSIIDQFYGYNADNATSIPVDYLTVFTKRISGDVSSIPNQYSQWVTSDQFFSYYGNAGYTLRNRYSVSASARKDESNLFGVKANQKGIPLYSMGLAWDISKESFYRFNALPYLRIRLTNGYSGNLTKNLSAYTTSRFFGVDELYHGMMQIIVNPPNPSLSWEKVHNLNAAIEFGTRDNRLSGSLDIYSKKGENLIGNSPVAPQTGFMQFTGNVASLFTKGAELLLRSVNLKGPLTWTSSFQLAWVRDKVTEYKMPVSNNSVYVNNLYRSPLVGKPLSSLLAFAWAGLDSTGKPRGYLNGKISEDYAGILNSTNINELAFRGPSIPTWYGGFCNTFGYKGFSFSFNITWKMGYYFRRGSYDGGTTDNYHVAEFAQRWQKPGDEKHTDVPGVFWPVNFQGSAVYRGSTALVEKGDHIRLKDLQASYTIDRPKHGSWFSTFKFYCYADNLGIILWRANKRGLDPDYVRSGSYLLPAPRTFSLGFNAGF